MKTSKMSKRIAAVFLALAMCCVIAAQARANDLALGRSARTASTVEIQINPPVDLNFRSRSQILQMRERELRKHPELMNGSYSLSEEVFGPMEEGKAWWGTLGMAFHGAGPDSIKGPAEESRFIMNPYLLIGQAGIIALGKSTVREDQLSRTSIPVFIQPSNLRWWPREGKAEVTYEYSEYERQICKAFGLKRFPITGPASLEAINARDLGLTYIYIPPQQAANIRVDAPMSGPLPIPQMVHCGGTCGYPGGCNNMSPAIAWLDRFAILALPARLVIYLWKTEPSTEREPADMIYTMNFR